MDSRKYYEAYDERYMTVHGQNIRWFSDVHSAIISETIQKYGITKQMPLLELGCGEGRDSRVLLNAGYRLLATDISPEAVRYCRVQCPEFADAFQVLDCINGCLDGQFDLIYAVAVIHMLLLDQDRDGFYRFIYSHLTEDGIGLILTMGDGNTERSSDINAAFELQERKCQEKTMWVAGTSCRMVSFSTFEQELWRNGFEILEQGMTEIPLEFPHMMYAVVRKRSE